MEPLQRMVRDGVMKGIREGFSSDPAAIVLLSSFGFSGLLLLELDAERALELLVPAGLPDFSLHRLRGSRLRDRASSILHGPLVRVPGLTTASAASYFQGVRHALGHDSDDFLHCGGFGLRRSWDCSFAFTFLRRGSVRAPPFGWSSFLWFATRAAYARPGS